MDLDLILNEVDRVNHIENNDDFKGFYYKKLEELKFDSPTDDIELFFTSLNEEWIEEYDLDDLIEIYNKALESGNENINERFLNIFINEKFKRMIRGGKKIKRKVCPKGFKIVNNKCVKIKGKERLNRKISQRKGAKKRKIKIVRSLRKKKKSDKKRKRLGL